MTGANHLANEKSPYLLQHSTNPVDWYPWGEEAFRIAAEKDRPIFLSIGYSACHWCHVMERESFEDESVAAVLNRDYVSIKVDREERPDVDEIYMRAAQMIAGSAGWPLTIIMTPDRVPFFAATYMPPTTTGRMTGLLETLTDMADKWKVKRVGVEHVKEEIASNLRQCPPRKDNIDYKDIESRAFQGLKASYDRKYGGFEHEPKFPSPHRIMFLLRHWRKTGSGDSLHMATWTLKNMAMGGIHDHLAHGFHRYSVDNGWKVPHFEKMLYDQAMLAMAYSEGFQASHEEWMKEVARNTCNFVLRELSADNGAFCASLDADSEGEEGKYYTWTYPEVQDLLGPKEGLLFASAFNLRTAGNYHDPVTGNMNGRNVLYRAKDDAALATSFSLSVEEISGSIERYCRDLKIVRDKRPRPRLDDKVLLDWNGLMLAALAKAGRICPQEDFVQKGRELVSYIEKNMRDGPGLLHAYRNGAGINGYLTDYAYYGWGLLELHQATLDEKYLDLAEGCAEQMLQRFPTPEGGFFLSMPDPLIIARGREVYDGAVPSGNSVAHMLFSTLAMLKGRPQYGDVAHNIAKAFGQQINRVPHAHAFMALSMMRDAGGYMTIGVPASHDGEKVYKLPLEGEFLPETLWYEGDGNGGMASVCRKNACLPPVGDLNSLMKLLDLKKEEEV